MIKPRFILSNYIIPELIKVQGSICNASFFTHNSNEYLLGRQTNYTFCKDFSGIVGWPFLRNYFSLETIYTKENDMWKQTKNVSTTSEEEMNKFLFVGDEDFRIINWNNNIYCSFTRTETTNEDAKNNIFHGILNVCQLDNNLDIINKKQILTDKLVEKNWQPIEDMPFKFIYSYKPFVIIDSQTKEFMPIDNKFEYNYYGSSQAIKYKEYYLSLVHLKIKDQSQNYFFYFVLFDKNMNLVKISKPFKFFGANIEFSTYIGIQNNALTTLLSVNDQITYKFSISFDILNDIFNDKLDNNNIHSNIYDNLFYDSLKNKNYLCCLSLATYSNNKDIKYIAKGICNLARLDQYNKNYILGNL